MGWPQGICRKEFRCLFEQGSAGPSCSVLSFRVERERGMVVSQDSNLLNTCWTPPTRDWSLQSSVILEEAFWDWVLLRRWLLEEAPTRMTSPQWRRACPVCPSPFLVWNLEGWANYYGEWVRPFSSPVGWLLADLTQGTQSQAEQGLVFLLPPPSSPAVSLIQLAWHGGYRSEESTQSGKPEHAWVCRGGWPMFWVSFLFCFPFRCRLNWHIIDAFIYGMQHDFE